MPRVTTATLSAGYNAVLAFGSYTITKITLTATSATDVTFFDSDDTNRAIVHAATTSVASSQVDKYTQYVRSTTAGEQGRPILRDTPGSPSGQSIEVPSETAPTTTDFDDPAAANDYTTQTGTTLTPKYTGITQTVSNVTANSQTVPSFGGLSCGANQTATLTGTYGISRGLVVNSTGTATLTVYY